MFNEPQIRSDVLLDYPVRTLRSSSTILTFVLSAQLTSSPICQGQSPPVLLRFAKRNGIRDFCVVHGFGRFNVPINAEGPKSLISAWRSALDARTS